MFACCYGVAFGAIQQLPQIVPGIDVVKLAADAKVNEDMKPAEKKAAIGKVNSAKSAEYTKSQGTRRAVRTIRIGHVGRHSHRSTQTFASIPHPRLVPHAPDLRGIRSWERVHLFQCRYQLDSWIPFIEHFPAGFGYLFWQDSSLWLSLVFGQLPSPLVPYSSTRNG